MNGEHGTVERRPAPQGLMPLLALLVLTLPFYRTLTMAVGPVALSVVDAITIVAGLYLIGAFLIGRPLAFPPGLFGPALAVYLFAVCASLVDAYNRGRSIHYLFAIGLDLVLFLVVYQCLLTPRRLRLFASLYVVAATVLATLALAQGVAILSAGAVASVAGTLTARNEMVYLVLPGFAIALAESFRRGTRRWPFLLATLVMLAGLVVSRGRVGLLFCLGLLLILPLVAPARARGFRRAEPLALWGLVLAVGLAFASSSSGRELMARYTTSVQDELADRRGSTWTRYEVLRGAMAAFRSAPVFGIGADNFKLKSGFYIDADDESGLHDLSEIQAHSTYVGSLAETGIVGFLGLCGLVASGLFALRSLRHAEPEDRPTLAGLAFAFATLAAYLAVFDAGARPTTWLFLAVALAVREVARPPGYRTLDVVARG